MTFKPIADRSIDFVYCTVVFMHLEQWDRYNYVEEAFRVLRRDGKFYVDSANLCSDAAGRSSRDIGSSNRRSGRRT